LKTRCRKMVGFLFSGPPMHIDDTTPTSPLMLANEADAAQRATTTETKEEGSKQIAALRDDANEGHIAEHIRGMVAATMGNLSVHASEITRNHAKHWQQWALGAADDLALPVAG